MSRYIDYDKLIMNIGKDIEVDACKRLAQIFECINNAKVEDVAEVVRCKDCTHWKDASCYLDWNDLPFSTNADDFCSYGERKEKYNDGILLK